MGLAANWNVRRYPYLPILRKDTLKIQPNSFCFMYPLPWDLSLNRKRI